MSCFISTPAERPMETPSPPMIRIRGLTRSFGKLRAVDGLDLEIFPGEIFGLVGPDGAGKTTTLRALCGLLDPDSGSVEVAGLDVAKNPGAVKDQLGYMAQRFGLYGDLSVEENLAFYGDLFGVTGAERDARMERLMAMTRMAQFRARPAAQLSGGMKRKLALMCALLHKPRVLILDEPTNGVDPVSRRNFWKLLYSLAGEGMSILVSTAYLDEAERCHRVGLMHQGRLIRCAPPAELRAELAPRCFAWAGGDPREARSRLMAHPAVIAAEPAGAALHVYLAAGADPAAVGPLRPIPPILEDVFIALIREQERHAHA
jgi:ABC-2 type transport system ATP-binding protein